MTERDTDIEFDFFDEPETREAVATRPPRRPRPAGRPPAGVAPILRLVGLIVLAILVVVVLVLWVQSCRSASKRESYQDYMANVTVLADSSRAIGRELGNVLATPGIRPRQLSSRLSGFATRQQEDVARAQDLSPPGPLRNGQEHVIEAFQLRASGLRGLADTFRRAGARGSADATARLLATQAQRLVASDVLWDDLFMDPAKAELRRQGIGGVAVPDSNFVQDPDLATRRGWLPVLQRIRGATTGGTPTGLHGNALVSVRALPGGQVLQTSADNTIRATTALAFEVTVENSGGSQEVQVPVTMTIAQRPSPIVKRATIAVIDPGEQKTVVFRNLPAVDVGTRTTLEVEVQPVPGERNRGNNAAEYPVIFSLTPP